MWLLEQETKNKLLKIPAAQALEASSQVDASGIEAKPTRNEGSTAVIDVSGILAKKPNWSMFFFGGTLYPDVISQVQAADNNKSIKDIVLNVDSPGGNVDGLFETMDAIKDTTKPITARVSGMAASAAYGIASMSDKVVASNRSDAFGSIGVAADYFVSDSIVEIASTNAPKKRPDVTTEEGKAAVREELDTLHDMFVESIADGRSNALGTKVSTDKVNKNFGQGALVFAKDALTKGMIDSIEESGTQTATPSTAAAQEASMDIAKLKMEHPTVYAEAVKIGVAQERDRVTAHLTYGDGCGAMETAVMAVKDGSEMTETLLAEYRVKALNAQAIVDRDVDDPEVPDSPEGDEQGEDPRAKAVSLVEYRLGLKAGGE